MEFLPIYAGSNEVPVLRMGISLTYHNRRADTDTCLRHPPPFFVSARKLLTTEAPPSLNYLKSFLAVTLINLLNGTGVLTPPHRYADAR